MLKRTVTCLALVSVLFLGKMLGNADQPKQKTSGTLTGTLQKMIVENGSVTINVDLNGLNGSNDLITRPVTLQFAAGTNNPITCPPSSKVGSIEVETPTLPGILGGEVYVGQPLNNNASSGEQFRLFLHVTSARFGVNVRLVGNVFPNPQTGQITALIKENPQAPFEHFKVHIDGGPKGVLTTPDTCGPHTTTAELTPFSSTTSAKTTSAFSLTEGAGGGPCPKTLAERPFGPTYSAGTQQSKAGAFSPFVFHLTRPDGAQEIRQINVNLPPGMVAKLKGIPYCPQSAIDAATAASGAAELASPSCPANSLVGTSQIAAGSGPRRCTWCNPSFSESCTTSMRVPHGSSMNASLKRPGTSRTGLTIFTPAASNSFIFASMSATEKPR